jgi:phage host-nuclease inhibitor protein Gam
MAPRIKTPAFPVPQTAVEFEELAVRLGEVSREMDGIAATGASKLANIKLSTKKAVDQLGKEAKALWGAISAYAEAHRVELLPKGRKSKSIAAGTIGWRTSTPAIQIDGDEDEIILRLEAAGLHRFLRETVVIDKAALLAEPEVVKTITGLSIVQVETLFFKPLDLDTELTLKGEAAAVSEAA